MFETERSTQVVMLCQVKNARSMMWMARATITPKIFLKQERCGPCQATKPRIHVRLSYVQAPVRSGDALSTMVRRLRTKNTVADRGGCTGRDIVVHRLKRPISQGSTDLPLSERLGCTTSPGGMLAITFDHAGSTLVRLRRCYVPSKFEELTRKRTDCMLP